MRVEIATEHPHIVRVNAAGGERAFIKGTRISVDFVVANIRAGDTPESLVEKLPHLDLAGVYGALSYYHDHRAEIEQILEEGTLEYQAAKHNFTVGEDGVVKFNPR